MKKVLILLVIMLVTTTAYAETYSKAMVGASFGNENACLMGTSACFDNDTDPQLNTDRGYYFYVVPIAVRKELMNKIGIRLESEFSVSKREFDAEEAHEEYTIKVDGDDTRYAFGGNVLFDFKTAYFTPYAGLGLGIEYSKIKADFSGVRGPGPYQVDTHDDFGIYNKWIAGIEIPITGNIKGNIEYNYRSTDRFRDNDSQANWNLDGENIINAGLSLYW